MANKTQQGDSTKFINIDMALLHPNIGQLEGLPANPRHINEDKYRLLKKNIQEYPEMLKLRGLMVFPLPNKHYIVIGGNMRYRAMSELGYKDAPCVIIDADTPVERLKAYTIIDNNAFGEYDWDMIANEWDAAELADWGLDIPDDWAGFEMQDEEAEEDDFDESTVTEAVCKRGDIWQLGEHRLMCGDSTSAEDVAKLMDGVKAELLFTSPPYSDIREYNGGKDLSTQHLAKFISTFAPFARYQAVNLGMKVRDKEVEPYWDDYTNEAHKAQLKMLSWNVWDKMTCGSIGMQKYFIPCRHEWVFVYGKDIKDINRTWEKKEESLNRKSTTTVRSADGTIRETTSGDVSHKLKRMESVLSLWCETGAIRQEHPATFPVGLPSEYINALTNNGDNVIDCFGGSGSTLIACEQLNRKCYMMELDPHYCDVIIARWEKLTGNKAEKIG